ncbi:Phage capsid scaffolding protein (GPO) serine peptidase [Pseudomonas aeruginosa]|nr:Phage capsid scaffolding protein (GPO) serine peptidase [Pseudomonas aeruginosa]
MASTAPAKKFRSKWTRIAVEGATTDGRKIERTWIEQMAAQYSPNTYGARINCEHIKWAWPGGEFGAYGDVVALKAEEVEINGDKKLALLAQLEPNDALLAQQGRPEDLHLHRGAAGVRRHRQGLSGRPGHYRYPGQPGYRGAVLQRPARHPGLAQKAKDNLFTAAEEVVIEFEEVTEPENKALGLFNRVMEALGKSKDKSVKDDAQFSELSQAVEALANYAKEQGEAFATERTALSTLKTAHEKTGRRVR